MSATRKPPGTPPSGTPSTAGDSEEDRELEQQVSATPFGIACFQVERPKVKSERCLFVYEFPHHALHFGSRLTLAQRVLQFRESEIAYQQADPEQEPTEPEREAPEAEVLSLEPLDDLEQDAAAAVAAARRRAEFLAEQDPVVHALAAAERASAAEAAKAARAAVNAAAELHREQALEAEAVELQALQSAEQQQSGLDSHAQLDEAFAEARKPPKLPRTNAAALISPNPGRCSVWRGSGRRSGGRGGRRPRGAPQQRPAWRRWRAWCSRRTSSRKACASRCISTNSSTDTSTDFSTDSLRVKVAIEKGGEELATATSVSEATAEAAALTLLIVCPAGVGAGDTIFLTAPDGQELEVAVPEGVAEVRNSSPPCSFTREHPHSALSSRRPRRGRSSSSRCRCRRRRRRRC